MELKSIPRGRSSQKKLSYTRLRAGNNQNGTDSAADEFAVTCSTVDGRTAKILVRSTDTAGSLKKRIEDKWDLPALRQLLYRDAVAAAVGSQALPDASIFDEGDHVIVVMAPEPVVRLAAELGELTRPQRFTSWIVNF
jgi:hypothetical protein